jgi:hypothetical protein
MNIHYDIKAWQAVLIGLLAVWELFWKVKAAWRASQRKEIAWFIMLLVINSVGLLPILYLTLTNRGDEGA